MTCEADHLSAASKDTKEEYSCAGSGQDWPFICPDPGWPAAKSVPCSISKDWVGVAVDVDYKLFEQLQKKDRVCTYVHGLISGVSAIYNRAGVDLKLSALHIWEKPYAPQVKCYGSTSHDHETSKNCMIQEFQHYWDEMGRDDFPGDITHILSGYTDLGGGLGYTNTLCDPHRSWGLSGLIPYAGDCLVGPPFPVGYVWAFEVVAHELAHNFGSYHTQCYDPPIDRCACCHDCKGVACKPGALVYTHGTILSYCHMTGAGKSLRFAKRVQKLLQRRVKEWRDAQDASCHDGQTGPP